MKRKKLRPLWIDSHAHLSMLDAAEISPALDRAASAGVDGVLVPATSPDDLETTLGLAAEHCDRVVAAVGVHPHEACRLDRGMKQRLTEATEAPGVVAVGEIGLDYHYLRSPREDQLGALAWQLDLASEARLPVILHNRESWSDLEPLLARRAGSLRGVCHSFTEGLAAARRVVEFGLLVGISGMVTFKRADVIRQALRALTPASVLVETDSPYLAPEPRRGRRNEPAYVVYVGERVAKELKVSAAVLATATTSNFRTLFGLDEQWPRVA